MRRYEGVVEVEEVNDVIDAGTTIPVRCRLENGINVVVKYMKNQAGPRVLVNEWVGSCIADKINLTIPEYGICNLSENVINNTNFNEEIDIRNAGLAFYTKDYSSTVPPNRGVLSFVCNKETERIILFDHIVKNADRHEGNLLIELGKVARLYVIDNSHIITLGAHGHLSTYKEELSEEGIFSKVVLKNNEEIYNILCSSVGYNEKKMFYEAKDIKDILKEDVLEKIFSSIPNVWVDAAGKDYVDNMFLILRKRIQAINEICEMIVKERSLN